MKKTIIIIAIVCILGICIGWFLTDYLNQPHLNQSSNPQIANWPSDGMAGAIPPITWSDYGKVEMNNDDCFHCVVSHSSRADFMTYVDACAAMFFEEYFYDNNNCLYAAETAAGDYVCVGYSEESGEIVIVARARDSMPRHESLD